MIEASVINRLDRCIKANENGCWICTAPDNGDGYCQVRVKGRRVVVHRLVYELTVGPVPDGMQLDHRCRQRRCCNPAHLEPVTSLENTLRGLVPSANRTMCRQGKHVLAIVGTKVDSEGVERCRACRAESKARWQAKVRSTLGGDPFAVPAQ